MKLLHEVLFLLGLGLAYCGFWFFGLPTFLIVVGSSIVVMSVLLHRNHPTTQEGDDGPKRPG